MQPLGWFGLWFGVFGFGFRAYPGFRAFRLGFWGSGLVVSGFGFRVRRLGLRIWGLGFVA